MSNNSRRMIFPYTFGAKLVHFPYKYYWEKSPFFRMYVFGIFITVPIFRVFTKLSHSPSNYEKIKEAKKREHEEHARHVEHLL